MSETLFNQPSSILVASLLGFATSLAAATTSDSSLVWGVTICIAVVGLARSGLLISQRLRRRKISFRNEVFLRITGLIYALLAGMMPALAILLDMPAAIISLLVVFAIAYATGAAARSAGCPQLAISQTVLTELPIIAAALFQPEPAYKLLGLTLLLMIPALISVTGNVFNVLRDSIITARTSERLAAKIQHLARIDPITGLLNRAGLTHYLVDRVAALPTGRKLAMYWLDLDRFKEVNDLKGHYFGDQVLIEVAQRLVKQAGSDALIGRFGGDEFIVVCDSADHNEVQAMADALIEDFARAIRIDGERLEISASMGVAIMPDHGQEADALIHGADLALYEAKANGRGQATFFDPSMSRNLARRREIEAELRQALQREELSLHFQPIVDLESGRIRSFEALVRWFHPEKGELRPDEFIPVAEETGAIVTLGNWITVQAIRAAAQWPEDVTISVNLSPVQIKAPGAAMAILSALREARLAPERLELEITETVLLDDNQQTESFMAELAGAGVRLALDDFGTGYSSLGSLARYPINKIKVDRSFVSGGNVGLRSEAIICAVSEMGTRLGMEIVAEGVETAEQVEAVRAAGCTLGQGYYFSRALPDHLATLLVAQEGQRLEPKRATA